MILPLIYVDDIIKRALSEDINYVDVATDYLIPENQRNRAYLVAKEDGVICGLEIAMRVFTLLDDTFTFTLHFRDGDRVKKGDKIAEYEGKTVFLLKGERTALNLLQQLSGVATATAKAVDGVKGTKAQITDTRKTVPTLRALQKYAVTCGGGKNHRFNLSDAAMLKDNHIDAGGGIRNAVAALKEKIGHTVKIEVETRNLDEVGEALEAGADIIMLDNMSVEEMADAVKLIDGRALSEASGGITSENVRAVAETGVDIISLGAITHSVKAMDISMKMVK